MPSNLFLHIILCGISTEIYVITIGSEGTHDPERA